MEKRESNVDRVQKKLRDMAINFDFKPGERLNESALTSQLDVSRTPLREALNRLVSEGFLTLTQGQGFFCRALLPEKIVDLYQVRCALETEAVRRAIETASDQEIAEFHAYLDAIESTYDTCADIAELVRMDEEYHLRMVTLSGNAEMVRMLNNVNERLRFVRSINLRQIRERSANGRSDAENLSAHRVVADAIRARDADAAITALRKHIERRSEQVVELVQLAYSQLYVPT